MSGYRISIQGEAGSFHEVAAKQYFAGNSIEIIPCATFDQTLAEVKKGKADFGVMAIENARAGSILYNYTIIRESGLKILGEHNLRVRQNLMALPGQNFEDIKEIWSHPIAFSQCMSFLDRHPGIKLIETEDTAGSARIISERKLKGIAAIASSRAAEMYGLKIIAPNIETYHENYTRFLVIGSRSKGHRTGNKASICFSVGHKPGSLAGVLTKLAELNINLTKIQSVPRLNGKGWEYLFYLDLELPDDSMVEAIPGVLGDDTRDLEILGIYMKNNTIYDS